MTTCSISVNILLQVFIIHFFQHKKIKINMQLSHSISTKSTHSADAEIKPTEKLPIL